MDKFLLIIYYLFKAVIFITPVCALKLFASALARILWLVAPKIRRRVLRNLIHFSQLANAQNAHKIGLLVYKRFAFYILMMVKNLRADKDKLLAQIAIWQGFCEFEQALLNKRQIIFTTAHFCNWELLPSAVALRFGCELSIVGKALRHKSINKLLTDARQAYGVELIDKNGAIKQLLKAAKNGRVLGLVTDQDAAISESCEFSLWGKKITQSKSASMLAKRLNALLIAVYIYPLEGGKYGIKFFPAMDANAASIEELSAYQHECTRQMCEEFPSEYFWFHKKFKTFYEDEY